MRFISSTPAPPTLPLEGVAANEGQRAALEVAEAARDAGGDGFGRSIFMGRLQPCALLPFPTQSDAEAGIGDQMVARVAAFLNAHLDPEDVDATRTIPENVIAGLKEMGVLRMKVPLEYGGLGYSQVNYNRVLQALASFCGSTAVLVSAHQSIGLPQPVKQFGTEFQKEKYLRMIAEGALSAFALTEPEVGSDPARLATTAVLAPDGSHYILNGEKLWTTNGPIADLLVVMAQTAPRVVRGRARAQITAFIVERAQSGVEVAHRCDFMGLRGIQNGLMRFTNVRVPRENLLWGEGLGLKLALRTLNTGRLTLPAACAGVGKRCLEIARVWGNQRVQWGLPIGKHEAGRDKIATIAATTLAMEAVTWLTSHWADQGRDIRIEAAMAKLFCSEAAWRLVDMTLQLRGGRGYERAASLRARGEAAYPVERMMRDCRINTIIEGTSEIMRLYLAREALDGHLGRLLGPLDREAPIGRRVRSAIAATGYYSRWYPARTFGRLAPPRCGAFGPLAGHMRRCARSSNRLAQALLHAMARYGPGLQRQQMLLGSLMDIGTELFAMSATCAYAMTISNPERPDGDARDLADVFCRQGAQRIAERFATPRGAGRRQANVLAGRVLKGEYRWLERGIIETDA